MSTTGLAASEWNTVAAKATAADTMRYEPANIASLPYRPIIFAGLLGEASTDPAAAGWQEVTFSLQPHDLLPADLCRQNPGIRTFQGHDGKRSKPGVSISAPRVSRAMFSHQGRMVCRSPAQRRGLWSIASGMPQPAGRGGRSRHRQQGQQVGPPGAGGWQRRKRYVIAISAAGSTPRYHGGTVGGGLGAITTLLNRVNEVYQRDVAAEFQLASGKRPAIIFTDGGHGSLLQQGMIPSGSGLERRRRPTCRCRPWRADPGAGRLRHGHVVNTGAAWRGWECSARR